MTCMYGTKDYLLMAVFVSKMYSRWSSTRVSLGSSGLAYYARYGKTYTSLRFLSNSLDGIEQVLSTDLVKLMDWANK